MWLFGNLDNVFKQSEAAWDSQQGGTGNISLDTNFVFRPGCRTKKRSAIVRQGRRQIERDLWHNELQKACIVVLLGDLDRTASVRRFREGMGQALIWL
jgi:hypothetical protein